MRRRVALSEGPLLSKTVSNKSSFQWQGFPDLLALLNLTFSMNTLYFRTGFADIKPFCKSFSLLGENNGRELLSFYIKGFILITYCCTRNYVKT